MIPNAHAARGRERLTRRLSTLISSARTAIDAGRARDHSTKLRKKRSPAKQRVTRKFAGRAMRTRASAARASDHAATSAEASTLEDTTLSAREKIRWHKRTTPDFRRAWKSSREIVRISHRCQHAIRRDDDGQRRGRRGRRGRASPGSGRRSGCHRCWWRCRRERQRSRRSRR